MGTTPSSTPAPDGVSTCPDCGRAPSDPLFVGEWHDYADVNASPVLITATCGARR
jgi:hypothetical protein